MLNHRFHSILRHRLRTGTRLLLAAALAAPLALPAIAADQRAVQSRVAPVYPELAKRMKITGAVKIEATVDPEGKVVAVKTISGNRALGAAAEEAVKQWKFVPGPATSTVEVDLNFGGA